METKSAENRLENALAGLLEQRLPAAEAVREIEAAREASELDARLDHFLKNRSYVKALAYLRGDKDVC